MITYKLYNTIAKSSFAFALASFPFCVFAITLVDTVFD